MIPDRQYRYSVKKGMAGSDVWAVQIALNDSGSAKIAEDGEFGDATDAAVRAFQKKGKLTVDGIAGPATQRLVAVKIGAPLTDAAPLPKYLLSSLIEGESGWINGCVNWSIPGGVDCGYIQDRVTWGAGGPESISEARWRKAFGKDALERTVGELRSRKDSYYGNYPGAKTHRRAWEVAVLWHNWPWGANELLHGRGLSTKPARWVLDIGVRGVESPAEWAEFYIRRMTVLVPDDGWIA